VASRSRGGEAIKEEDEDTPVDRSPGAVKEEEVKNIGVDGIENEIQMIVPRLTLILEIQTGLSACYPLHHLNSEYPVPIVF
jgi:hypothetical protein